MFTECTNLKLVNIETAYKNVKQSMARTAKFSLLGLVSIVLSGCGDDDNTSPCFKTEDACLVTGPEPVAVWWDAPIPDLSENAERPTISLIGERTIVLPVGDFYLEEGAIASDDKDGNISGEVTITGNVDTDMTGDYLVRYSVTDSDGNTAIEQLRIVRVVGSSPTSLTKRALGTTYGNFGYFEHLPTNYGETGDSKPPLLFYFHGSGANLEFTEDTDPITSLDAIIENYGIPKLIQDGQWDNSLPFVVIAPHVGQVEGVTLRERLNAFVDYAIHSYDIDASRVYMTGWSSGGFISSAYAVDYPEKIAAVVPIASGLGTPIENLPDDFCDVEQVPFWLFHGTADEITPFVNSIRAYNAIVDTCQPRVIPKLSLVTKARHHIHHAVYDLTLMSGGSLEAEYDPRYDPYDQSVFEWMLSHSLDDRQ
ncbi:immunoglobulin-like domain-containing protein [Thalassotalea euphylliae]|uniref:immunoglobulin-like domain-containing protein n=1 Tax=Thalassotalea euphylliae TaxID=1655234 RepID=UPI0036285F1D